MSGLTPAESGELISRQARHVKILAEGVDKCAEDIARQVTKGELDLTKMFVKTEVHPQTADEHGISWVFFADTLNFSFWQPERGPQYLVTYKGVTYSGYLALCAAINRAIDAGRKELIEPAFFHTVDRDTLASLLRGDQGVDIPLLEERLDCLHQVGSRLVEKYSGRFSRVLEQAGGSAVSLLQLVLTEFPCFRDTAVFNNTPVSFHKRAQILVADIWCLFAGTGSGCFNDIDQLTMFADYRVPQSLQHYGVFRYDEELMAFLKTEHLLEPGHRYELEIRGCSIHAVELITRRVVELLAEAGNSCAIVNSILVDQYLWGYRRQNNHLLADCPYHRVRSIYY